MLEFRVTADNPKDLYIQAVQALAMLVKGGAAAPKPLNPDTDLTASEAAAKEEGNKPADIFPATDDVGTAEAKAVKPKTAARKKGAPAAPPTQTPAAADAGGIPDFLDRNADKKPPVETAPAKEYTLVDCREQVRLCLENFVVRARAKLPKNLATEAAKAAEDKILKDKVAYTLPLLTKFGVQKASDIPPEKFGEFMEASKAFVEGTA